MGNGKLALLLPTYRFDATARHCIQTVASMGNEGIDVFIGDNSENPEKQAFLRDVAAKSRNCHVFCHEHNIGGPANWRFLLHRTDHEFISPISDDDCFTPDFFYAGLDELRANPECSAASGLIIFTRYEKPKMEVVLPLSLAQDTALERIGNFFIWTPSMEYSVHRSEIAFWFQGYVDARPYVLGYTNQFLDYAILCHGKYIINPERRVFVYNNHNWANEADGYKYEGSYYAAAGFPRECAYLQFVFWAADILHFFNSSFRPTHLSDEESHKIMEILFNTVFGYVFQLHLNRYAEDVGRLFQRSPAGLTALKEIVHTPCSNPHRFLSLFVTILRGFNIDLAHRYKIFVEETSCFKNLCADDLPYRAAGKTD